MSFCTQEKKSTHRTEVIRIEKRPHPNADSLSIVEVFSGGHQCVVRTEDWNNGDLAAYVVPDSLVPADRDTFRFLREKVIRDSDGKIIGKYEDESVTEIRIKAKRLRGIWSEGLLVPAPPGLSEGDDASELLGVSRYDPDEARQKKEGIHLGGDVESVPPALKNFRKYDIDAWNYYKNVFMEGEPVWITEKLHGSNARYVWFEDRIWVGSREQWKKEFPSYDHITKDYLLSRGVPEERAQEILDSLAKKGKPQNMWWKVLRNNPSIEEFCKKNPNFVLYGEIYGHQDLRYAARKDEVFFAAFDVMNLATKNFLDWELASWMLSSCGVPLVPVLYRGPYYEEKVKELTDGQTTVNGARHVREGVVIKPEQESWHEKLGRKVLKRVSNAYLERA